MYTKFPFVLKERKEEFPPITCPPDPTCIPLVVAQKMITWQCCWRKKIRELLDSLPAVLKRKESASLGTKVGTRKHRDLLGDMDRWAQPGASHIIIFYFSLWVIMTKQLEMKNMYFCSCNLYESYISYIHNTPARARGNTKEIFRQYNVLFSGWNLSSLHTTLWA